MLYFGYRTCTMMRCDMACHNLIMCHGAAGSGRATCTGRHQRDFRARARSPPPVPRDLAVRAAVSILLSCLHSLCLHCHRYVVLLSLTCVELRHMKRDVACASVVLGPCMFCKLLLPCFLITMISTLQCRAITARDLLVVHLLRSPSMTSRPALVVRSSALLH